MHFGEWVGMQFIPAEVLAHPAGASMAAAEVLAYPAGASMAAAVVNHCHAAVGFFSDAAVIGSMLL